MSAEVVDIDLGWNEILRAAQVAAGDAYCKVGVLGNDARGGLHKKDPVTGKAEDLTIAEIAIVNEYGTEDGRIPARSFVRATFDKMRAELTRDLSKLIAKVVIDRKLTVEQALNIVGLKLAVGVRNFVTQGDEVPPPNAPSVLAEKTAAGNWNKRTGKGPRTLVDTGAMINAVSWAVVLDDKEHEHQFVPGSRAP